MKKHGLNTENISHAVLRLGTKLWRFRAPLTFLYATSWIKPQSLQPESSGLTTRPLRQPLKIIFFRYRGRCGKHATINVTKPTLCFAEPKMNESGNMELITNKSNTGRKKRRETSKNL